MKTIFCSKVTIPILLILLGLSTSCSVGSQSEGILTDVSATEVYIESPGPQPTVPNTVPELIGVLLGDTGDEIRIVAARKLGEMGPNAAPAIQALVINLYDKNRPYEVREAAAWALGQIGPASKPAVPVLIVILRSDFVHVRRAAAEALGKIGDKTTIFALVQALDDEDNTVSIEAAESIALLSGQRFPDMGTNSYRLDESGIPLIVKAAKEWWRTQGQFHDWLVP